MLYTVQQCQGTCKSKQAPVIPFPVLIISSVDFIRFFFLCVAVTWQGARPALCEGPSSRHMREYYLRCLVESLLADRLREATAVGDTGTQGEKNYSRLSRHPPPPPPLKTWAEILPNNSLPALLSALGARFWRYIPGCTDWLRGFTMLVELILHGVL